MTEPTELMLELTEDLKRTASINFLGDEIHIKEYDWIEEGRYWFKASMCVIPISDIGKINDFVIAQTSKPEGEVE